MRAGLNLAVDIVMKVGMLEETMTVVGESPLLETSNPGQAVNVSGEMAQSIPLAARRHWSEFLRFTPGAVVGDGTQNTAGTFYVHGAGFNSYVTTIDGSDMSSAQNPWPGYSDLAAGTLADVQIATSGLDASTPLGYWNTSVPTNRAVHRLPVSPSARPAAISTPTRRSTRRTMPGAVAPSARRRPISICRARTS